MSPPPPLPGSYLVLELTNRCSLACVHCAVAEDNHPHHQHTGYLDPHLARALFADLVASGARFDALILFWLGEPLLHPHFSLIWQDALRTASRHGTFRQIEVHTNATHLTAGRIDAALNAADVAQAWHISLDAATRSTYTRIKGRDRFDVVLENTQAFLRRKALRAAPWPRPVLQFIVGSNNVQEVAAFEQYWTAFCADVGLPVRAAAGHVPPGQDAIIFFRQLDCPTPELQAQENAVFERAMAELGLTVPPRSAPDTPLSAKNLHPCSGFWKSPVISWRGELTACTRDNALHNALGSLTDAPFSAMWWGRLMKERREKVARGDYGDLPLCRTCFIPRSLNHTALSEGDIERMARWEASR